MQSSGQFISCVSSLVILALALPAAAQGDGLAMLGDLSKGEWTIKFRGEARDQKICVRTGRELIQIKHDQDGCNKFVVEDRSNRVTVQYTCAGDGYGRTDIRKETDGLIQLESRGIASGLPFQIAGEARRTGSC